MPYKRKITPAVLETKARYEASTKQIQLRFKKNSDLLAYLRSRVTTDAEIPSLIKQIIEDHRKA
jgi:hypothetical protein